MTPSFPTRRASDLHHPHRVGGGEILHQHQPPALRQPRKADVRPHDVEQRHDDHHRLVLAIGEAVDRSEEHTSELQSLMRISYAVSCLNKKKLKQKIS